MDSQLCFIQHNIIFNQFISVSYFYRQTTTSVPSYYQPINITVFKQGYLQNKNWKRFKLYSFLVVGSAFLFVHTYNKFMTNIKQCWCHQTKV